MKLVLFSISCLFMYSCVFAGYVYRYVASINGKSYDEIVFMDSLPSSVSDFGYNDSLDCWNWYIYIELGTYSGPPQWMKELGATNNVSVTDIVYDEDGNMTSWKIDESYDLSSVPWGKYGITCNVEEGTLTFDGTTLCCDYDGNLSLEGHNLGLIDTSNPSAIFSSLSSIKDVVLAADGGIDGSADKKDGYLPIYGTDTDGSRKTYYYDPNNNSWWDWSSGEMGVSVSDPWGLSGTDGGGTDGGGTDGGGTDGGGTDGGGTDGGGTDGSGTDGGGTDGGGTDGGGTDGGGTDGGGTDGSGTDGGGTDGSGTDGGGTDGGGTDGSGTDSGSDYFVDYSPFLSSIANDTADISSNSSMIVDELFSLSGSYDETVGASSLESDGSVVSDSSTDGLNTVKSTLEGLTGHYSSGWGSLGDSLFSWLDSFSAPAPLVLDFGTLDFTFLGLQKPFELKTDISSVQSWLSYVRRAFFLLWSSIGLYICIKMFRFLSDQIVKGVRWLLGLLPKSLDLVAK